MNVSNNLQSSNSTEITTADAIAAVGAVANQVAANHVFHDYTSRKADNTTRAQHGDLSVFSSYLNHVGIEQAPSAELLQTQPDSWQGMTWGIVEGFVKWQLSQGYTVASVNRRLSTVKTYAKLAAKAGTVQRDEYQMIKAVSGYGQKEAKRVNERRETTRIGNKKAEHVSISPEQAQALKQQPNTPQGRRDAVMMCLLLDHGLRVGEVAALQVSNVDLKSGYIVFDRPKVDKDQKHKLSADTLRSLRAWVESGDCEAKGPLLRGSRRGGELLKAGMSERSISQRVRALGVDVGLYHEIEHTTPTGRTKTKQVGTLSAHDCRHYWATHWADKVDVFRLQEAGGWNSLAMPRRYVEKAKVANEGMA